MTYFTSNHLSSSRARIVAERFVACFGPDVALQRSQHLRERILARSTALRDTGDFARSVVWLTMYRHDLAELAGGRQ